MIQFLIIIFLLLLFSSLVVFLFKKFDRDLKIASFFIVPLVVFSLGFVFRLTAETSMVDLGFFFTDFSELFVSVLFASCLILGQIKYWKVK